MFRRFFLSERNMMIAIILNAMVIFMLYFPAFKHDPILEGIDHFFIVVFLLEAIVKIVVLKPKAYFKNSWNCFDFFIVIASLPSLLMQFVHLPDTSVLLILRLLRLVRLIRFIEFVPNIGKIIKGLVRAIRASVFVLGALLLLNFLLSIFTCHFYAKIDPEHFGDPLISAYSIFQMFTVEGWNEIPNLIAEKSDNPIFGWITRFYFVMIVLVGGIFGMSLANAVFVDEMTMDNNDQLEKKIDDLNAQILELKQLLISKNSSQ